MAILIWESAGARLPGIFEFSLNRFGFALALIYDPDSDFRMAWMLHVHLFFLNLFIHLPGPRLAEVKDKPGEWQQWGFGFMETYIALHRKYLYRSFDYPWAWRFLAHEVRRVNGSWVPFVGSWEQDKESDDREIFTYPYSYILKSGEVQHVTATVHVDRYISRRHCFWFTSRFDRFRQSIYVEFSGEVGERSGSWKGGTIGCGYEMRERETPERTLRRMEQERKF